MNDPLVYLNGNITPLSQAHIPVMDRGFIFGDGIYEVIPVYQRKMFRSDQHLARLFRSMDAIGIPNPHSKQEWLSLIRQVMDAHPADDQMVYLQVTRGVAKRAHAFPAEMVPTVFIMTNPIALASDAARNNGVKCVSMEDQRWLHCDIKSISLLGNVLAAQNAVEHGAVESIQFRDGFLTEASASNVWIVKDGVLIGPPKDHLILEGIRYGLIEEICAARQIPLQARRISRAEVFAADEVMLSSATKEVLAVVQIDEQTIGKGLPGPIYQQLYAAYQEAKAAS
ncbi:D-amino acid aminotransferase [Undibacterium piscinae]|uniref:D-amino acid aminotransferase n=1 Tax=Undibacterium piscinae TaxID=2495591 RepID=A0A6M4A7M9_9BURK|nr:D-amino acid aminotransferase [Undibacterium piscinae]